MVKVFTLTKVARSNNVRMIECITDRIPLSTLRMTDVIKLGGTTIQSVLCYVGRFFIEKGRRYNG